MSTKLTQLAERRKCLIDQSSQQRTMLAQAVHPWRETLARADQGIAALHYVKQHPLWLVAAGGLVLSIAGPSRVWRWLGRGMVGLQLLSRLRIM